MDTNIYKYNGKEGKEAATGIIKGILGQLPYFGSLLNEVLFDIRSRIQQNRINNFVIELGAYLNRMENVKVNKEFLQTPEFIDTLEKLLSKTIKTKYDEKIKLYSRIIGANISQGFIRDFDLELSFIDIIDQLTINELLTLKYLLPKEQKRFNLHPELKAKREEYRKTHSFDFTAIEISYYEENLFGIKPNDARISIEGLIAKSLVYDDSASRIGTKPRTFIGLTPLGSELIHFINDKNDME